MPFLAFALAAASPLPQQLSDGDAIVALAWERRRKDSDDPANACVEPYAQTMAEQIRDPNGMLRHSIAKDDANRLPNPARLRRIFKGEGETLTFDVRRLGLPAPSPGCRYRYGVAAPVVLGDNAYVHVGLNCGGLCGAGEILLLVRRDGKWEVAEQIVQWMS